MPELILHFSIPFALSKVRFGLKESIIISLTALLPDLDALMHIHRWLAHSLIITSIAFTIPIAIAYALNRKYLKLAIACYLAVLSHIVMDLFQTYTPILYPITNESIHLKIEGNVTISNTITPKVAMALLIISLMLIAIPTLLTMGRTK